MCDVMLDLETLSTKNNAIILIIGAIKFNRKDTWKRDFTLEKIDDKNKFYKRITIESCEKIGLHRDTNTEKWWNNQDKHVREEAFGYLEERVTIHEALKSFTEWFGKSTYIWGNGSIFDITIMSEAYDKCGLSVPWKFYNVRDLRSILDVCNIRLSSFVYKEKHNALYDCFYQIKALQACGIV
jgi:hypothetical protein